MKFVRPGARPVLCALFLACVAGAPVAAAPVGAQALTPAPFVSDRLSVEVVGAGPDVILIPGLGSSREVWRETADRLKARHRVHLVQLAGFAGEPWTHGDGAFVQPEVDELARYIRAQGLDRPAVIGHSLGGLSGLLLAQQHPDLVGRLMTVDSLPFYSAMYGPNTTADGARPFADQAAAMIIGADQEGFRTMQAATAQALSKTPGEQARIVDWSMASDRRALASAMKDVMTTDARPGLSAMTTPVTALYAADADGGPPPAMAEAVWGREYATLPGVRLTRVDASRHFIMADQPQRFAELVDAFLSE
ncbi:alpha/beta fold hydrolase [Brevundimonas nasdae]|uniref:alpha/beta fold hydrolase n=1 Tax=Brevundimonas nasdae TaxID=172043 RepID=UPI003F68C2D5